MKITFDLELLRYGFLVGMAYQTNGPRHHFVSLALGPVAFSIAVTAA